ncbi:MAG: hypothetical protein IT457_03240 [Planctomycetes bacterium]|nr:hypothetical protein [Planctomycetota bacterium]
MLELLGSEPELLAIADAITETQGNSGQASGSTPSAQLNSPALTSLHHPRSQRRRRTS